MRWQSLPVALDILSDVHGVPVDVSVTMYRRWEKKKGMNSDLGFSILEATAMQKKQMNLEMSSYIFFDVIILSAGLG